MDHLYLDVLSFPVRHGELYCGSDPSTDYRWGIEIRCDEPAEADDSTSLDGRTQRPLEWLFGSEPYLYAQMLPLRVASPGELIGREFSFLQTPVDEPAEWPPGIGWPFFCLYTWEHDLVYPMRVAFTAKRGRQYRVEISGEYSANKVVYDLRVQAWLDWQESNA